MESCFIFCIFCSYRPFCRHPGCPGRKTMKAQSLLFRTSTLHFQHCPQKTTHDALTPPWCYFSAVALPSLCLPACPPCFLAARSPPQIFLFLFPFLSRCAQEDVEVGVIEEEWHRGLEVGQGCAAHLSLLSAAFNAVTSAGRMLMHALSPGRELKCFQLVMTSNTCTHEHVRAYDFSLSLSGTRTHTNTHLYQPPFFFINTRVAASTIFFNFYQPAPPSLTWTVSLKHD